jgi:hypothetical protein
MAQLVIAAAGAAIGAAIPGFGIAALGISGASLGWTIGGLVGSAFTPGQKSSGPRLSDLSVSSSAYGTPIPYTQGGPRLAGQIVWASTKREIATTTRQGKGGGKNKVTTYAYEVDLLILLTDNEIDGISRVWRDGKLIWNKSASATNADITQSDAVTDWTRITAYAGAASQLPDPTYEAAVGAANAPAYRGRGAVFIEALQLGQSGALPNLTFEIGAAGYVGDHAPGDGLTRFQTAFSEASSADISAFSNGSGTNDGGTIYDGYFEVVSDITTNRLTYGVSANLGRPASTAYTFEVLFMVATRGVYMNGSAEMFGGLLQSGGSGSGSFNVKVNGGFSGPCPFYYFDQFNGATDYVGSGDFSTPPSIHHFAICYETDGTYNTYLDGVRIKGPRASNNLGHINGSFSLGGFASGESTLTLRFYGVRIRRAVMYSGASPASPASPADWGAP